MTFASTPKGTHWQPLIADLRQFQDRSESGTCPPTLLESVDILYSTAIFTLSLPIFATTIVPLLAENVAVPSIAVAEPRAAPSIA